MYWQPVYTFTVKNEKRKMYQRIDWFIIALILLFFIITSIFAVSHNIRTSAIATMATAAVYYTIKYFFYRKHFLREGSVFNVYIIFAIAFFSMHLYVPAGIVLLFSILSPIATIELPVKFFNDRLQFPRWPYKEYKWNEISNVILKDGLLTIDCKNNRVFQELIVENDVPVDEKEFNEFCRQHLNQ